MAKKTKPAPKEHLQMFIAQMNPEAATGQSTMQPMETNPYGRVGPLPPTIYNFGNQTNGYQSVQPYFDPE